MTVHYGGRGPGHLSRWSLMAGISAAALSLDFTTGTLDPRITFSRASSGTYFDASGVLQLASTNSARFDYDPVTLQPRGLLIEEQRTNLLTYSQEFDNAGWVKYDTTITANATTSPSGDNSADLILPNTSNAFHAVEQTVSIGTRTFSLYAKAAGYNYLAVTNSGPLFAMFNLSDGTVVNQSGVTSSSITAVGNGWYRCVVTLDATYTGFTVYVSGSASSVTSFAGDGTSGVYLWGAQAEAGAFATSYIPTVASQVTRTADVATITGANFSQWYNQSEGTFVAQFDMIGGSAANTNNQIVLSPIADASNRHIIYNGDAEIAGYTVVGGVTQAYLPMGSLAANTTSKMAYAYQVNNFAASQNGGAVSTDTSGSLPVPTLLGIGSGGLGGNQLNGHIRRITYYPSRLSNAQLQALSA